MKQHIHFGSRSDLVTYQGRLFSRKDVAQFLPPRVDQHASHEDKDDEADSNDGYLICGPIDSGAPKEHWRRVTLWGNWGPSVTVQLLTVSIEIEQVPAAKAGLEMGAASVKTSALQQFVAVVNDRQRSFRRRSTTGLEDARNAVLAPVYDSKSKNPPYDNNPPYEMDRCVRSYPVNVYDTRIWHEPSDPRGNGTSLWVVVLLHVDKPDDLNRNLAERLQSWGLTVETFEFGWERDLPPIYQRPTTSGVRNAQNEKATPEGSLLLDEILGLFEANADTQQQLIDSVTDWFVPEVTPDPIALANHLGVDVKGLKPEQVRELLGKAFDRFLSRGTVESFLAALEIFTGIKIARDNFIEPLLNARIRLLADNKLTLDDLQMRLDDPLVLLAGWRPISGASSDTEGPEIELTGLDHLMGIAYVRVAASDFKTPEDKRAFEAVVDRLAPAHMKIGVEYVGGRAVLDRKSQLNLNTLG